MEEIIINKHYDILFTKLKMSKNEVINIISKSIIFLVEKDEELQNDLKKFIIDVKEYYDISKYINDIELEKIYLFSIKKFTINWIIELIYSDIFFNHRNNENEHQNRINLFKSIYFKDYTKTEYDNLKGIIINYGSYGSNSKKINRLIKNNLFELQNNSIKNLEKKQDSYKDLNSSYKILETSVKDNYKDLNSSYNLLETSVKDNYKDLNSSYKLLETSVKDNYKELNHLIIEIESSNKILETSVKDNYKELNKYIKTIKNIIKILIISNLLFTFHLIIN